MRLFVAIFPPMEVSEALIQAATEALAGTSFRPTRPENVHLTLKFLGNVPGEKLDDVRAALGSLGEKHSPFGVSPCDFGAFPSLCRAKVFWAGVGAGMGELEALASDVDVALDSVGFGREARPFAPHFTLGRARRPVRLELEDAAVPQASFVARGFDLVESVSGGSSVTYRSLAAYPLVRPG